MTLMQFPMVAKRVIFMLKLYKYLINLRLLIKRDMINERILNIVTCKKHLLSIEQLTFLFQSKK